MNSVSTPVEVLVVRPRCVALSSIPANCWWHDRTGSPHGKGLTSHPSASRLQIVSRSRWHAQVRIHHTAGQEPAHRNEAAPTNRWVLISRRRRSGISSRDMTEYRVESQCASE